MLNIILFGPPGAGKGTQSEKLVNHFNLLHISTGDLFRKHKKENTELGKLAQKYMDDGVLVPDEVTIQMVDEEIENAKDKTGIIFDGFPRTVAQAEALDQLLAKRDAPIRKMLALEVSHEVLKQRILERGKTSGRVDDQDEAKIQTRIQEYEDKTLPVANHYEKQGKFESVNGVGEIDAIFDTLVELIETVSA